MRVSVTPVQLILVALCVSAEVILAFNCTCALNSLFCSSIRAIGRPENPGGACSNMMGIICPPLVEIGLTDLSKSGGQCSTGPPVPTALSSESVFVV